MYRLSIDTKRKLAIIGLVISICASAEYALYYYAKRAVFDEVRAGTAILANSIAVQINAKQHLSILSSSDENGRAYKKIKRLLTRIKNSDRNVLSICTIRPGNRPKTWALVVDAEPNPSLRKHVGTICNPHNVPRYTAGIIEPFAYFLSTGLTDRPLISGFAPIRDGEGRFAGMVRIDMSPNWAARQMAFIRSAGVLCIFGAVLAAFFLSSILAKMFVSPVSPLVEGIKAAVQGNTETVIDERGNDEIGELARNFNEMMKAINNRDKMLREMNTDYLTGLNNHRYFQQRLQDEIALARKRGGRVALLMIDIDMFKLINDSLGHLTGDEILLQISRLLRNSTSNVQILSRYGGEEFAIIMCDKTLEEAMKIGEDLRHRVAQNAFEIIAKDENGERVAKSIGINVTVSMGVAVFPDHSREQDGLIMAADIAMHRAKQLGRNRICAYDSPATGMNTDPYHIYTFIQDPSRSAIEALAAAVDARDHYTRNHSESVSRYACTIAEGLGLKDSEIDLLRMAGLLHDVGKIGVPDHVLNKAGRLDKEEMEIIRTHPAVGEAIVRKSYNLEAILPGILYHHEHYDGSGYPEGLSGDNIPLIARIIAVADAFDALITNRPYRKALSVDGAKEVLIENKGSQFDPKIVDVFIKEMNVCGEDSASNAA